MMQQVRDKRKLEETKAFLFLTIFLAPILAVTLVGGYGLLVWLAQSF